jgi:hypothetical protein
MALPTHCAVREFASANWDCRETETDEVCSHESDDGLSQMRRWRARERGIETGESATRSGSSTAPGAAGRSIDTRYS